jgi:Mg-chelatase subunit ChlD
MKNSGVADIAFIIDTSGSMNGVFDYLIQNLTSFVGQIQNQSKTFNQFDIRIGVIAGDNKKFFIVPFTNNYQSVVTNLKTIKKERVGGNEIMCYGIDLALIELDWRTEGRRIMVMITDEKLATNHSPKELRKGITSNLLKKRIEGMGILFYIISPECPDYEKLAEIEKSLWIPIKLSEDLKDYSLIQHIFEILNKSISKSMALKSNQRLTSIKEKDYIYLFPETEVVFL